ncbi:MAG: glycosyltransferase family 4 protein [Alphaproteobacteria bacterium]
MSLAGRKIGLMLNDDFSMLNFRGGLIRQLVARGADVTLFVPPGKFTGALEKLGARVITIPMYRFMSPIRDLGLIWRLYRVLKREHVDILHTMTIKPNIYGAIAAKVAGIPKVVGLVSGAGTVFARRRGLKDHIIGAITALLYKTGFKLHNSVWFQNPDDADEFVQSNLLPREKVVVIRSGGINTDDYAPGAVDPSAIARLRLELGIGPDERCVVMIARMIWSKGVREFVEAARQLQDIEGWRFVALVPWDVDSPEGIPESFVTENQQKNTILVNEFRTDARIFAGMAEVGCLPSYYREGVPRSMLEFLAFGIPLVTTDWIGCREVVIDGRNGFLVPIQDSAELAKRFRQLLLDEELRARMGVASRALAVAEFSESVVAERIIADVYGIKSTGDCHAGA